jgi:hypothetical protein
MCLMAVVIRITTAIKCTQALPYDSKMHGHIKLKLTFVQLEHRIIRPH